MYRNPPPDPQPESSPVEEYAPVNEPEVEVAVDVAPPASIGSAGGLLFMQESELESETKPVEVEIVDQTAFQEPVVDQEPEEITIVPDEMPVDENIVDNPVVVRTRYATVY
jgi:hypothetical protein